MKIDSFLYPETSNFNNILLISLPIDSSNLTNFQSSAADCQISTTLAPIEIIDNRAKSCCLQ